MDVKLISTTKSLIENNENLTAEQLIVYCARVSNPSNQLNNETADKLIAYLIKSKHWSPFEMVDMTVEIKTSRAISLQIVRHRSFSFQEFSQRYSEVAAMEPVQLRKAGSTNRQSSTESFDPEMCNNTILASKLIEKHLADSESLYKDLLASGVAKECARMVLPATTETTIYVKGSVRSWIHYLQIRADEHSQLEHQQIALKILEIFEEQFPNITKALNLCQNK